MSGYQLETNGIVIIDFLGQEDYKTGSSLHETYIKPTWTECKNIFYHHAPTKNRLINILNGVISAAENQNFAPILHLESHGSPAGIATTRTGGEFMSWKELSTYLVKLNRATNFSLFLMTSSCHGANVISELTPPAPAPFWGNIGPPYSTTNYSLLIDFGEFYKSFLTNFKFGPAFDLLNSRIKQREDRYVFTTADYWFIKLYAEFVRTEGSKTQMARRVDRLFNQVVGAKGLGRKAQRRARARLMDQMKDHQGFFEKFRHEFFMEDDCRGTFEKFGVTYERVLEAINKVDSVRPNSK